MHQHWGAAMALRMEQVPLCDPLQARPVFRSREFTDARGRCRRPPCPFSLASLQAGVASGQGTHRKGVGLATACVEAFEVLDAAWRAHGPFDGVLGFSGEELTTMASSSMHADCTIERPC